MPLAPASRVDGPGAPDHLRARAHRSRAASGPRRRVPGRPRRRRDLVARRRGPFPGVEGAQAAGPRSHRAGPRARALRSARRDVAGARRVVPGVRTLRRPHDRPRIWHATPYGRARPRRAARRSHELLDHGSFGAHRRRARAGAQSPTLGERRITTTSSISSARASARRRRRSPSTSSYARRDRLRGAHERRAAGE